MPTPDPVAPAFHQNLPGYDLELFEIGGTQVTLATLIVVAAVAAVTLLVSMLLQRTVRRMLLARGLHDEGELRALLRIMRYGTLMLGFGVAFHTAGLNLTAFFAAGAVFALALGFAVQNIGENFVSGVILLVERSIKPDDIIEFDGRPVFVEKMGIRATIARTLDDERVIIPNAKLVQGAVKNYTFRDRQYRLRTTVGVAYSSDMDEVGRVLAAVVRDLEWRLAAEPRILLVEFAGSSVVWEVSVWIDDPWSMRRRRSEMNLAVWRGLGEAKITIAFPQLDVHLDRGVVEALESPRHAP
ncbi:MAG: mechanosensitive ion channel domain-containing protein [Thermoanaerobaculia bacterium]